MSTVKKVRLKQDEEKLVVAYANLKLKQNRLAKEIDTMKQSVVNLFEDKKVNVIFAKDKQDNIHIEIINKGGKPLEIDLENLLEKYIIEYVVCNNDQNPETDVIINGNKVETKCRSCGFVKDITNIGILSEYYASLLKKIKKENKKNKKKSKENN